MRTPRIIVAVALSGLLLLATACIDERTSTQPPSPTVTHRVLAPIVDAAIVTTPGSPTGYAVRVESALPNGCHHFAGAFVQRPSDDEIRVQVENEVPADPHVACTMIYGTHVEVVDLGSNFVAGRSYTVIVNGERTLEFTAR